MAIPFVGLFIDQSFALVKRIYSIANDLAEINESIIATIQVDVVMQACIGE